MVCASLRFPAKDASQTSPDVVQTKPINLHDAIRGWRETTVAVALLRGRP